MSISVVACSGAARAGIRPSFWLSRCAWDASEVVELTFISGEAHFLVTATLKGATRPGAIKIIPELAPPKADHSLLGDLASRCSLFGDDGCYGNAPPILESDRFILFLRRGDQPAGDTLLTSAIWIQDGVAYAFQQTSNPGPTHLVEFFSPSQRIVRVGGGWKAVPELNESAVRNDIADLLSTRAAFDRAVANPNPDARAAELARLISSMDQIVIRHVLEKLNREGQPAADALRPLLDDDALLYEHFRILDAIAVTKARNIRLAPIIQSEIRYWGNACDQKFETNWTRSYGQLPAIHYLRLVSTLNAIHALGISSDLPAVSEFMELARHCTNLSSQTELRDVMRLLLAN